MSQATLGGAVSYSQLELERQAIGALCTNFEKAQRVLRQLRPEDFLEKDWCAAFLSYYEFHRYHPNVHHGNRISGLGSGNPAARQVFDRELKAAIAEHAKGLPLEELLQALEANTAARGLNPGRGVLMSVGAVQDATAEVHGWQKFPEPTRCATGSLSARAGGGPENTASKLAVAHGRSVAQSTARTRKRIRPLDLNRKPPVETHLWHGLLAPGAVTLLHSRAKLGKSFLGFGLMRALLRGEPFLGRPTLPHGPHGTDGAVGPAPMVYMSEEGEETLGIKKERFEIGDAAPVIFLSRRDEEYAALSFEEALAAGFEDAQETGAKLLVLDTLSAWAGLSSGAEHFAARGEELFKILKAGAKQHNAAVLVLHHSQKNGRELRGSSALEAAPDVLIRYSSPYEGSRRRVLHINTRLVGDFIPRLEFEITETGYSIELKGREHDLKKLLEFIPLQAPGISVNELTHESEMRRAWVYEALGILQGKGIITLKEGNGSKYFPTRVWRSDPQQTA